MRDQPLGIYNLPYDTFFNPIALSAVYHDMRHNYYWSDDFSGEYYVAQAKRGFIAVTDTYEGKELLLPEIQFAYAVLHFENLHISKHVARILKRKRPELIVTKNLSPLFDALRRYHDTCWLTPRYQATLEAAHALDENFRLFGAYIQDEKGDLVAGEVGYIIGKTYTSLSGFSSKEPRYRNYGKVQMTLLARYLQAQGFAFWNLGQPYMQYKFDLGALRYERDEFLAIWYDAITQEPSRKGE